MDSNFVSMAFSKTPRSARSNRYSEEVIARAELLDIKDYKFYWIAEQSMSEDLLPWESFLTAEGHRYFYNSETGESVWTHPALSQYTALYNKALHEGTAFEESPLTPATPSKYAWDSAGQSLSANSFVDDQTQQNTQVNSPNTNLAYALGGDQVLSPDDKTNMQEEVGSFSPAGLRQTASSRETKQVSSAAPMDDSLPEPASEVENDVVNSNEAVSYWRGRYDKSNIDKQRLDRQIKRMEGTLQKSVVEQAEMHETHYQWKTMVEDCVSKMSQNGEKAIKFLHEKGFHLSGKLSKEDGQLRRHVKGKTVGRNNEDDVDGFEPPSLPIATTDLKTIVDLLVETITRHEFDEKGFAENWEGAFKRISKELTSCFHYDINGKHYETATFDLQHHLSELTHEICAFGEYLNDEEREDYLQQMIKHVSVHAPVDGTMVPLQYVNDMCAAQLANEGSGPESKGSGSGIRRVKNEGKGLDSSGVSPGDKVAKYVNLPPSSVATMRAEIETLKSQLATAESTLTKNEHDHALLLAKYEASEARLSDVKSIDEKLSNNFASLTKGLEDIRMAGIIGGPVVATQAASADSSNVRVEGVPTAEFVALKEKIASLNVELDLSNKRADVAEEQTQKMLNELDETQAAAHKEKLEYNSSVALLKNKCHELKEYSIEQKKLTDGICVELDKSIAFSRKLESERENLLLQLETLGGEQSDSDALKGLIEDEKQRNTTLENMNDELRTDVRKLKEQINKLSDKLEHGESRMEEVTIELTAKTKECGVFKDRTDRLKQEKSAIADSLQQLKRNFIKLNDHLVEIQGNIRVFCRVRPVSHLELSRSALSSTSLDKFIRYPDYNLLEFDSNPFEFDRVFPPTEEQEDVFAEVEPVIRSFMTGCKVCIFAYGQTSSGKTHTMIGPANDRGVNMRAFETIFSSIAADAKSEAEGGVSYRSRVTMSMLEVYNEKVRDLLVEKVSLSTSTNRMMSSGMSGGDNDTLGDLEVRMGKDGAFVENLSEWCVKSVQEVGTLIAKGGTMRKTASNNVNEHSSRSHLVIIIKLQRENLLTGQSTNGCLHLVDLAGSERLKTTSATGQRLREAQHINKSLSALGDVIAALASGQKHVPYRNSKLTFLLQEGLRDKCKALMFVNVNPMPEFAGESVCSLQFASRCRSVQLGQAKKNVAYHAVA